MFRNNCSMSAKSYRPRHRKLLTAMICVTALSSTNTGADDNQKLENAITALITSHNTALPVALAPIPVPAVTLAADLVVYGTNIGLKYVKAPLIAPSDVGVMPNSADMCSYRMTLPQSEAEYKNLLGIWDIQKLPTDWGPLGRPVVSHANTDVTVSVDNLGTVPFARTTLLQTTVFPAGTHSLQWQAETQISPTFDVALPLAIIGFSHIKYIKSVLNIGDQSAAQVAKQTKVQEDIAELLRNIAIELELTSADLLIENGIVSVVHSGPEHVQKFSVFDVHEPEISTDQLVLTLEATDFGGVTYQRVKNQLYSSINASDPCGRGFTLSEDAPPLLPLGTTDVLWTVRDYGPNRFYQENVATLTQTIVVEDTQAPLMVPPPGRVIEIQGTGLEPDEFILGYPRVVDLADSKPLITNDIPTFFPKDSRTEVIWRATDASGNTAEATQLITIKQTGTNSAPVAESKTAMTLTSAPVDIVLTGNDADILDGRADPLSFNIEQQPANGEFIAPLFPFFIEDYRTQPEGPFGEEFLLANPRSKWVFENFCAPDNIPWDAVFEPVYMHVADDGTQFIYDHYWTCDVGSSVGKTNPRVSKWDRDGNYLGQASMNNNTLEQFVLDRDGYIYFIDRVGSGSSTDLFLKKCSTNFGTNSTQCDTSWKFNYSSAPDISPNSLVYARVDSQQGIAFVTDKRRVFAFDIRAGGGESPLLGTLFNGEQFLTSCTAVSSRAGFTIEIDSESNLYVVDSCEDRIHKFAPSGFTNGGVFVAGDYQGWLGRCDSSTNNACDVNKGSSKGYSCTNTTCFTSSTSGDKQGQFNVPLHMALDPNDVLYVADYANRRIQRFAPDGTFAGEAMSTGTGINQGDEPGFILGNFDSPKTVSVNSTQFFIVDQAESFVHVFDTSPLKDITDNSATVTYVSDFSFHSATDTFTYSTTDGLAKSNIATVNVSVARNFRAPEAFIGSFSGIEDQNLSITLSGDDPDGVIGTNDVNPLDVLTYQITKQPEHGSLQGSGASYIYTPNPDFYGEDSLEFITSDGVMESAPATVTLSIAGVNDPPTVQLTDSGAVAAGFPFAFTANFYDDNLKPEAAAQHQVLINWGDGTTTARGELDAGGALVVPPAVEAAPGVITASHTYNATGAKTVIICVVDDFSAQTCETTTIQVDNLASLATTITPSADAVSVGDEIEYEVEIFNVEPSVTSAALVANAVTTNHLLPVGLQLVDVATSDSTCTVNGNEISCNLGDMAPGESRKMTVSALNNGSQIYTIDDDFNVVSTTTTPATNAFYLGAVLTSILADATDSDNDGIFDVFEVAYGLNPSSDDAALDADGDGLSNIEEFLAGTSANNPDSDNDGMTDAWEMANGLNPLSDKDAQFDSDHDGFSNLDEFLADRSPTNNEQTGNRLVPILSRYDNSFLFIPAVQIGADFYDLELELRDLSPVTFELIGFKQRPIQVANVPDANTFDVDTFVLNLPVTDVLGELYALQFTLIGDSPVLLQLTAAGNATTAP